MTTDARSISDADTGAVIDNAFAADGTAVEITATAALGSRNNAILHMRLDKTA